MDSNKKRKGQVGENKKSGENFWLNENNAVSLQRLNYFINHLIN